MTAGDGRATQTRPAPCGRAGRGDERRADALVRLDCVEPDDAPEEEGPYLAWLPPDDRLWRHPSEGPGPARVPSRRTIRVGPDTVRRTRRHAPGPGGWTQHPATRIWAVAIVAGLVGAVAASGVGMMTGAFEQQTTVVHSVVPTAPTVTLASATSNSVDWTAVDDAIAPSVVEIQVTTASGPATGSGVVFQPGSGQSYIVTDSALVAGASGIQVSFVAGQQYRGQVVGTDPVSGLAVVAVAAPTWEESFPPLGTVGTVRLANPVLALGARANAPASLFSGSIAAEDREVDLTGGSTMDNLIAVCGTSELPSSAAGGPLVDQNGTVVGITLNLDPTNSSDESLLFAVPVDVAVHVADGLLARASVTHPWLGVTNADDVTSVDANQYGLSGGAEVGQVVPGSPAARLGLGPSDIITAVNGNAVTSSGSLTEILYSEGQPGHPMTIRYLHNGKPLQASINVVNQPPGD